MSSKETSNEGKPSAGHFNKDDDDDDDSRLAIDIPPDEEPVVNNEPAKQPEKNVNYKAEV